MAWQPTKPLSTDNVSAGPAVLTGNWVALQNIIGIDHVTFAAAANQQGKHRKVTFPVQAAAPPFLAGELGLYNLPLANAATTRNQLFIHKQLFIGTENIPFAASIRDNKTLVNIGNDGYTYLPSGIIIKWGRVELMGPAVPAVVNYNVPGDLGPAITREFCITSTMIGADPSAVSVSTPALGTLNCYGTDGRNVYWMIIGV